MKKISILSVLFLLPFVGISQKHSVTYGDTTYMKCSASYSCELKDSLPSGEWTVFNINYAKMKKPRNEIKDLYTNPKYRSNIERVVNYRNGVRDGVAKIYQYKESPSLIEDYYKNGELVRSITWYKDSLKMSEGIYTKGVKDSIWTSWYQNKQKESEFHYFEGVLKEWSMWYPNGKKKADGYGDYCYRQGKLTEWYENGNLKEEWIFQIGQPQTFKLYYQNGKVKQEGFGGEYSEDVRTVYSFGRCKSGGYKSPESGAWKYYNESGKLVKEENYDNGKLISTKEY
jgi:antitoxin component YwqK of YwqJK toxin-antitoxin module